MITAVITYFILLFFALVFNYALHGPIKEDNESRDKIDSCTDAD